MNCIKGSLMTVANTLSSAPHNNKKSEIDDAEITFYMHLIESNYLVSYFRLQQFKGDTKSDKTL